ncbi:MAG TPA: lipid-A-disaccharide synthase [Puia sp.]|nr:lipid-A-disaccharide synthase [Puia sp.]
MKYYLLAGEASGDLHGSNLIRELRKKDPGAQIRGWGGNLMEAAGAEIVKHYRDLAFMGFTEVVRNLPTILRNIRFCKDDIKAFHPDVIIFIDYPGFNLRIAGWAKSLGYKTVYYISPQVWAWKESRVKTIRDSIDKMLVILPFEKSFYQKWNYLVEYVGHPLVEVISRFKQSPAAAEPPHIIYPASADTGSTKTIIALLPGSRKQEILKKLPVMLDASRAFPDYRFIVAEAPGVEDAFYDELLRDFPQAGRVRNQTYALLNRAGAACVTSGTATLETALFGVPEVICYKGSSVSYQIARRLIKVKYISLVNLIMDKPVVKELIQDEMTAENIVSELKKLLNDPERQQQIQKDYADLKRLLSEGGDASAKAAESIVNFLKEKN